MSLLQKQRPAVWMILSVGVGLCCYWGFFGNGVQNTPLQGTLILCVFSCLFFCAFRKDWFYEKCSFCWGLSIFLGGMYAYGKFVLNGASQITGGWPLLAALLSAAVGFSFFYYLVIKWLLHLLTLAPQRFHHRFALNFFDRYPRSAVCLLLVLVWLPHLLLKYPGGMCMDSLASMSVGLGIQEDIYNQPAVFTLALTAFLKLGVLLGDPNLGIFLFGTCAMLALALAAADCYRVEVELEAADWSKLWSLLFFCFSPFVVGYVGVCIKDVPHMIALLFWLAALIRLCLLPETFWNGWQQPVQLILSAVCVVAFRSNGKFLTIPTLLLLLILEWKRRQNIDGKMLLCRIGCLLMACVLPLLTVSAVTALSNSREPSPREALSLPFQQTARLAKEHPEQISAEEAAIIDRVLDFGSLGEKYNPDISDPVKNTYNESATKEDLLAYLKLWFTQFFREPYCYLKATLAQNYYLFYPEFSNYGYYFSCRSHDFVYPDGRTIHISSPASIAEIWGYYYRPLFYQAHQLPVLYVINNMTTYVFLLLALFCFVCTNKRWKLLPVLLPALLSLGIIILAPCIRGHERYAFPIIYTVPLLYAVYSTGKGNPAKVP
ncbi:MAG: DUF6020 family protein [Candidatus Limivicinus sp.]